MRTSRMVGVGFCLAVGLGLLAARPLHAANPAEELFRKVGMPSDTVSLIEYLRGRSAGEDDLPRIDTLVRQLESAKFKEREQAGQRLIALGAPALPALRLAIGQRDIELVRRAKDCIKQIERQRSDSYAFLPRAAVRLLIERRAKGAVEVLLRYLPFTDDPELEVESYYGLDGLAVGGSKIHPALIAALRDKVGARRAVAACIIGRVGDPCQKQQVRKLLTDQEPTVQLRAAQGLLAAKDTVGIPTLIGLLSSAPLDLAWQAEELLHWVADEGAFPEPLADGCPQSRKASVKGWKLWWLREKSRVNLTKRMVDWRRPGLAIFCSSGTQGSTDGRVWLAGCDGGIRWELKRLSNPSEARVLAGGRLLLAERGNVPGVTERTPNGKVLWQHQGKTGTEFCDRLPNGNIVVAVDGARIAEIGPTGKEKSTRQLPSLEDTLYCYCSLGRVTNGRLLCLLQRGIKVEAIGQIDLESGRLLKEIVFQGDPRILPGATVEPLSNGSYLIAGIQRGWVLEVDPKGRQVWSFALPGCSQAIRLRNGNTLIGGAGRIAEVERDQVVRWEVYTKYPFEHFHPCLPLVRFGFNQSLRGEPSSLPRPLNGLSSKDRAIRLQTIRYLAEFGSGIAEAVPALTCLTTDKDGQLRHAAEAALTAIRSSPLAMRLKAVRNENPHTRAEAIEALGGYSDAAGVLAPVLLRALHDKSPVVRETAARVLGVMELEARMIVPGLIKAAQDPDAEVRLHAVGSLISMGPNAKPAIPLLLKLLKGKEPRLLAHWSAVALGSIGPLDKQVIPALAEALKDVNTRCGAAAALGTIGPEAAPAVPALLKALSLPVRTGPPDLPGAIRSTIVQSLGEIGVGAKAAIPVLIGIAQDSSAGTGLRADAVRSLGMMGAGATSAIPVLQRLAKGPRGDPLVQPAMEALCEIQRGRD